MAKVTVLKKKTATYSVGGSGYNKSKDKNIVTKKPSGLIKKSVEKGRTRASGGSSSRHTTPPPKSSTVAKPTTQVKGSSKSSEIAMTVQGNANTTISRAYLMDHPDAQARFRAEHNITGELPDIINVQKVNEEPIFATDSSGHHIVEQNADGLWVKTAYQKPEETLTQTWGVPGYTTTGDSNSTSKSKKINYSDVKSPVIATKPTKDEKPWYENIIPPKHAQVGIYEVADDLGITRGLSNVAKTVKDTPQLLAIAPMLPVSLAIGGTQFIAGLAEKQQETLSGGKTHLGGAIDYFQDVKDPIERAQRWGQVSGFALASIALPAKSVAIAGSSAVGGGAGAVVFEETIPMFQNPTWETDIYNLKTTGKIPNVARYKSSYVPFSDAKKVSRSFEGGMIATGVATGVGGVFKNIVGGGHSTVLLTSRAKDIGQSSKAILGSMISGASAGGAYSSYTQLANTGKLDVEQVQNTMIIGGVFGGLGAGYGELKSGDPMRFKTLPQKQAIQSKSLLQSRSSIDTFKTGKTITTEQSIMSVDDTFTSNTEVEKLLDFKPGATKSVVPKNRMMGYIDDVTGDGKIVKYDYNFKTKPVNSFAEVTKTVDVVDDALTFKTTTDYKAGSIKYELPKPKPTPKINTNLKTKTLNLKGGIDGNIFRDPVFENALRNDARFRIKPEVKYPVKDTVYKFQKTPINKFQTSKIKLIDKTPINNFKISSTKPPTVYTGSKAGAMNSYLPGSDYVDDIVSSGGSMINNQKMMMIANEGGGSYPRSYTTTTTKPITLTKTITKMEPLTYAKSAETFFKPLMITKTVDKTWMSGIVTRPVTKTLMKEKTITLMEPPRTIVKEQVLMEPPRMITKEIVLMEPPKMTMIEKTIMLEKVLMKEQVFMEPPKTVVKEQVLMEPPKTITLQQTIWNDVPPQSNQAPLPYNDDYEPMNFLTPAVPLTAGIAGMFGGLGTESTGRGSAKYKDPKRHEQLSSLLYTTRSLKTKKTTKKTKVKKGKQKKAFKNKVKKRNKKKGWDMW